MRVLFVSADIGGNVPPTLAIAGELAGRGHDVTVAGLVRPDAGVSTVPLRALAGMDVTRRAGRLGHTPTLVRMALGRPVAREVRGLVDQTRPDAVVVDAVMLTSLREAVRSGAATAALFHSLGTFWLRGMGSPIVNALLRPAGLAPLALLEQTQARLLPTDRELDPAGAPGATPRIAFDWVGTTERARPPQERMPGARPLVLVSLSSAWQRGQDDVYRRVIQALATLPVRAIVTTGGVALDGEVAATGEIEVRGRVPHADIMPGADLVIGHGGHSTTLKALAHGIPLLILPLDPTSDQPLIGRTIADAGLGRTLRRSAPPAEIAAGVRALLADTAVRFAAARIGERLRAHDGAGAAADIVERIAARE